MKPCGGCARRKTKLLVAGGRMLAAIGRPIPRRVLDVMAGVHCRTCGFTGDGVVFAWHEGLACGFCPKCHSIDLTPGYARTT